VVFCQFLNPEILIREVVLQKQNIITGSKPFAKPMSVKRELQESKASNFKFEYFFILIILKT